MIVMEKEKLVVAIVMVEANMTVKIVMELVGWNVVAVIKKINYKNEKYQNF